MDTETTRTILVEFSTVNADGSFFKLERETFPQFASALERGIWREATNGRLYNPANITWIKVRG